MRFLTFVAALMASGSAMAAECANVVVKDLNGIEIKTEKPLVAFMFPGVGPIVDYTLPAGATISVVGANMVVDQSGGSSKIEAKTIECPTALVETMNQLFKDTCLTDTTRKAAAASNMTTEEVINTRCRDLFNALNPKK